MPRHPRRLLYGCSSFSCLFFFSPPLFTFLSLLYIQPRYLPPKSSHRFCANTTGCKRVRTFSLSCQRPSTHPFRERAAPTPLPGAKEFHSLILSFRHAEVPSPSTTTTITTNTTSDLPVREGHAHSSPQPRLHTYPSCFFLSRFTTPLSLWFVNVCGGGGRCAGADVGG